jgi:hypothetical protein
MGSTGGGLYGSRARTPCNPATYGVEAAEQDGGKTRHHHTLCATGYVRQKPLTE